MGTDKSGQSRTLPGRGDRFAEVGVAGSNPVVRSRSEANSSDLRVSEGSKDRLAALPTLNLSDQRVGLDVLEARESRREIS